MLHEVVGWAKLGEEPQIRQQGLMHFLSCVTLLCGPALRRVNSRPQTQEALTFSSRGEKPIPERFPTQMPWIWQEKICWMCISAHEMKNNYLGLRTCMFTQDTLWSFQAALTQMFEKAVEALRHQFINLHRLSNPRRKIPDSQRPPTEACGEGLWHQLPCVCRDLGLQELLLSNQASVW